LSAQNLRVESTESNKKQLATELLEFGLRLVPLRKGTKSINMPKGFPIDHKAIDDASQLNGGDYGVLIGDGIVGIDIDVKHVDGLDSFAELTKEFSKLPATLRTRTTSGGWHLYYRIPKGNDFCGPIKRDDLGIEVYTEGRHFVAVMDGYTVRLDQITDAPEELLRKLEGLKPREQNIVELSTVIGPGNRNSELTSLAGTMRRKGAGHDSILEALLRENRDRCHPPLDEGEVRQIAKSVCRYDPQVVHHPQTDLGNAERLIDKYGEDIRYVYLFKKWAVWHQHRWLIDDAGRIVTLMKKTVRAIAAEATVIQDDKRREALMKFATKSEAVSRVKAAIELAKTDPAVAFDQAEFDKDPLLLCVRNGVVELRTGNLRPGRRDDFISKAATVEYDPNATCPTWHRFLEDTLGPSDRGLIEFMQRAIGYSLTGDTSAQCLFFLYGSGANGKSTFLTPVKEILGEYAAHTDPQTFMTKFGSTISNDIARLRGARFISAVETEDGRQLAESLVKQFTGQDSVTARFLYGEFFEFVPQGKLFLATNHKPNIRGDDEAIWRRIRLVPFTNYVPPDRQDKYLPEKLRTEYPGILNWMIEGCLEWQRQGLRPPKEVTEATAGYRSEQDHVGQWLEENCVLSTKASTRAAQLYRDYSEWCKDNHYRALRQPDLKAKLETRAVTHSRDKHSALYRGVGLLTDPSVSDSEY
jgi:putative DNA primase/helicase